MENPKCMTSIHPLECTPNHDVRWRIQPKKCRHSLCDRDHDPFLISLRVHTPISAHGNSSIGGNVRKDRKMQVGRRGGRLYRDEIERDQSVATGVERSRHPAFAAITGVGRSGCSWTKPWLFAEPILETSQMMILISRQNKGRQSSSNRIGILFLKGFGLEARLPRDRGGSYPWTHVGVFWGRPGRGVVYHADPHGDSHGA